MWVEKYRPIRLEEMVGNEDVRAKLVAWLRKWKEGNKAVILVGPPGTGKTTLVHLAAKECEMNLVDLNASDARTKEKLVKRIGEAVSTTSLFGERTLIFLDEVDGLSGRADYGAIEFIKQAIKSSKNPIVMAANDHDADQVAKLSDIAVPLRFRPPPPREMELYARSIIEKERLRIPDDTLRQYVTKSRGDIRSLINSVQSYRDRPGEGYKDNYLPAAQALNSFFDATDAKLAFEALRMVTISPVEKVRSVFTSVVNSGLPPMELSKSLEVLSRADMLLGNILRSQEWRQLRYLDGLLANELSRAIGGRGVTYREERFPWPVQLRVWNDSKKSKEIARRFAIRTRTSARSAAAEDLLYLLYLCGNKRFRDQLIRGLDLEEGFEKFLAKEGKMMVEGDST